MFRALNIIQYVLLAAALFAAFLLAVTRSMPLATPCLLLLCAVAFLSVVNDSKYYLKRLNKTLVIVILAIIYFLFRAWLSPVADLAREDLILILSAGLLYLWSTTVGARPQYRMLLAGCVVVVLIFHLSLAACQLLGIPCIEPLSYLVHNYKAQGVSGGFGYYGTFANFVAVAAFTCLSLAVWGKGSRIIKLALAVLALVAFTFVAISTSRAGVISLVVGFFAFALMLVLSVHSLSSRERSWVYKSLGLGGLVGFVTLLFALISVFRGRTGDGGLLQSLLPSDVRVAYWQMALRQFEQAPLFGLGSRSYSYKSIELWSDQLITVSHTPEFAHNEYLQVLVDYGLVGFLLVLVLVCVHLLIALKRVCHLSSALSSVGLRIGSNSMALTLAGAVGICVSITHVMLDFPTHSLSNLLLLTICFVWVMPISRLGDERCNHWPIILQRSWLAALAFLGMVIAIPEFRAGSHLLKQKAFQENGYWNPLSTYSQGVLADLSEAYTLAPSYKRAYRIGSIYQAKYAEESDEIKRDELYAKSLDYYKKAIQGHPFEARAHINIALLYQSKSQFALAKEHLDLALLQAGSCERLFRVRQHLAKLLNDQARSLADEPELASSLYRESINYWNQSHQLAPFYDALSRGNEKCQLSLDYAKCLIVQNMYTEALEVLDDLAALSSKAKAEHKGEIHYYRANCYYNRAREYWLGRKLELAALELLEAEKAYRKYSNGSREAETDADLGEQIKSMKSFMRETGIIK